MNFKKCSTCKIHKPYSNFHNVASAKDGKHSRCKLCEQYNKLYKKQEKRISARAPNSVPSWHLEDRQHIIRIILLQRCKTEFSGVQHEVDHVIPLSHPNVCGLHCSDNLQVLTSKENHEKSNKFSNMADCQQNWTPRSKVGLF